MCIFHKCFLKFFLLHLSSFCCRFFVVVVLVVVAPFILAGITVSDGTHDVAVAALETAGNLVPKGGGTGGLHDVGLDMNVHAFAKGSTFSVNMAESQRVCWGGGE